MSLQELIKNELSKWMQLTGPESDVVISSRVRLARNIDKFAFPHRATKEEAQQVFNLVKKALDEESPFELGVTDLSQISELDKIVLMEKHLISPQQVKSGQYAGVALSEDEVISLMINEEDHLRSQVLYPGFQIEAAYKLVNQLDNYLESKLDFAFSEKYGYLTACPTNVGTGIRASVMVHLPGLALTNRIQQLLQGVNQLGLAVRGVFGEGTEAQGNLYQISNQVTLGRTEEEIIDNLKRVTSQIINQERHWREKLLTERKDDLTDRIMRAYGVLMYGHKISSEEAVRLLSNVRMGIDLGIIKKIAPTIFNELIVLIRPGFLQKIECKQLSSEERDLKRADLIRKRMRMS